MLNKIDKLLQIYPPDPNPHNNLFTTLLTLLSKPDSRIKVVYLRFIEQILQAASEELNVLYCVICRAKETDNLAKLKQCLKECATRQPLCPEARLYLYLSSLEFVDPDPILAAPFITEQDIRDYVFGKIYHLFMRELAKYPDYYQAYHSEAIVPPSDYDRKIRDALALVMRQMGDECAGFDPDMFI